MLKRPLLIETEIRVALLPVLELIFSFFLDHALTFLDPADELVTFASNDIKVIVGELAPLLTNLALELLPVSCNLIFVHTKSFLSERI